MKVLLRDSSLHQSRSSLTLKNSIKRTLSRSAENLVSCRAKCYLHNGVMGASIIPLWWTSGYIWQGSNTMNEGRGTGVGYRPGCARRRQLLVCWWGVGLGSRPEGGAAVAGHGLLHAVVAGGGVRGCCRVREGTRRGRRWWWSWVVLLPWRRVRRLGVGDNLIRD